MPMLGQPKEHYAREWREWRRAHGMTQKRFAAALGRSLRMVQGIEQGEHTPNYTSRRVFHELAMKTAAGIDSPGHTRYAKSPTLNSAKLRVPMPRW